MEGYGDLGMRFCVAWEIGGWGWGMEGGGVGGRDSDSNGVGGAGGSALAIAAVWSVRSARVGFGQCLVVDVRLFR